MISQRTMHLSTRINVKTSKVKEAHPMQNEQTLVKRAAHHDAEAFTWLYNRSVDKIYKYIYYKVGSRMEAEDLTAQVFMKAWGAIRAYRWTERPFEAWLFRIAHNLIIDHYRTARETVPIDDLQIRDEDSADLDDIAQNHLDGDTIRKALKQLTEDQQQVILLKFLEGYNTDEVAAIMHKDTGAVRALQHRGLMALHRILKKNHAIA